MRFYHGDSLEVPQRYSAAPDAEKFLQQAVLNLDDRIRAGVLLRFVTETNSGGVPLTVKLVQYEEASDAVINSFTIPEASEASGGVIETFPKPQTKPGVTQPKPAVRPLSGHAKGQTDETDPSER